MKRPITREVKKPRESLTTMGVLPICRTKSKTLASVSSEVCTPRTISTSGIRSTGLKKWMPMTSLSRFTPGRAR